MKKKLIASISMVAAVSASFWACGEGNINPLLEPQDSQYINMVGDDYLLSVRDDALQSCRNDTSFAGCYMRYKAYLDGDEPIEEPIANSSDDSGSNQNPNPVFSSSSRGEVIIVTNPSSSSVLIFDPDPVSSSSGIEIVPTSGLGSCAPAANPIHKGQSTSWKFTPNAALTTGANAKYTPMQFASQADYKWNFGGLADDGSGVRATSGKVTYTNSGAANASVTVTMPDGASEVINCSPLQVNGDTITGCKCVSDATGSVDFTASPNVTWTVSGCTSASDITSYTWEGTPGETSFTKTFEAEAASYSPKLVVGNADKTAIEVKCEAVKITDGPEYTIKTSGAQGTVKLPAGVSSVVLEVSAYNNQVFCQISRDDSPSGAVNGTVNKVAIKGSDYVTASMPAGTLVAGATLSFDLDVAATCGVQ